MYDLLHQFVREDDCEHGPLLDRCCVVCVAKATLLRLEEEEKVTPHDAS